MAKTDTELLKDIIEDEVDFFTDKHNPLNVYVEYANVHGAKVFESLNSEKFKAFLGYRYREKSGKCILPYLDDLLEIYRQDVRYLEHQPITIHRQLAGSIAKGKIVYFLANKKSQSVIVQADTWAVRHSQKIKFLRSPLAESQSTPVKGGDLLKLLRPYVNLNDNDFIVFTVALVQAFSQSSSHYAMIFSSTKGTGKSTLTRLVRSLVEPSEADISIMPSNESDLKNLLAANYVVTLDNSKTFRESTSNILCSAITGAKEVKRKLYTDSDVVVLNLHNLLIINGIQITPEKSDLAERSLLFELLKIPKDGRVSEYDFWKKFQKDKPLILGAIFTALADAIAEFPKLNRDKQKLTRMYDANLEMLAIAEALGIGRDSFQTLLNNNVAKMQKSYACENPFVTTVADYVKKHRRVEGSSTEVYNKVLSSVLGDRRFFPNSSSAFTKKLNEDIDALNDAGIDVSRGRNRMANTLILTLIPQNQMTKKQQETTASSTKSENPIVQQE